MALRAVLFDLDDTLCDTIGTRPARARKAFERVRLDYPQLDVERLVARAIEPMELPRSARGMRAVLQELGLAQTPVGEEALRIFNDYHDPLQLFPGVVATVSELGTRYHLGIITNGGDVYQRTKIAHLRIEGRFPCIVTSGGFGYEKPDPRIFRHALRLSGVEPDEAIFIGDRLDVDVAGAKAAGMHAVWFNHWGGQASEEDLESVSVIQRFTEVTAVIDSLATHRPARGS